PGLSSSSRGTFAGIEPPSPLFIKRGYSVALRRDERHAASTRFTLFVCTGLMLELGEQYRTAACAASPTSD
ncbi:MAG: hypothetical protein QOJ71_487, partial [Actinomycetota bacterium]|nr:hypothetical protein [Actinomycetota bacterium]